VLGVIKKSKAITLAIFLYAASLATAYWLNWWFFLTIIGLMLITLLYTFFLKNIIIFDILTIATLFVIRAVSGTFLINAKVSPWLVLCPFFLSLFMSVGKRHSELMLLKDHAAETRKVLEEYNNGLTNSLMIISTTLLIISYALYSFLSEHKYLLITLPFAIFVIFRFFFLTNKGSEIARQPEKIIKDRYMVIGIIIWILITTLIIYLPLPIKY
ncbi:UbiA family prenyltransferase, partial [Candidatus Woesearchaeota archaeon]|nr:UbiA family prenyltransferase [Candidatus Woesearchaeota archaeon]